MSWRNAPLYVRTHDLALDLVRRVDGIAPAPQREVRAALVAEALGLLRAVSLALSFPAERGENLHVADRHVVGLKVLVRLAHASGVVNDRGARWLGEELVEIGRMIGGWQRQRHGPRESTSVEEGGGPSHPGG